jgi:nucleoid-associated protein YgaU
MQRDFKIGMFVGLGLVIVAAIWLATRPGLSPRARILRAHSNTPPGELQGNAGTPSSPVTTEDIDDNQSEAPDFTVYEQTEKIETQRFHIVGDGENLSTISLKYYGSATKWQKIRDANRSVVKDPDKIRPGTKLIIPD